MGLLLVGMALCGPSFIHFRPCRAGPLDMISSVREGESLFKENGESPSVLIQRMQSCCCKAMLELPFRLSAD